MAHRENALSLRAPSARVHVAASEMKRYILLETSKSCGEKAVARAERGHQRAHGLCPCVAEALACLLRRR